MKDIKYLKPGLRIVFGWHFSDLGYSYQLQRKVKFLFGMRWKKVAWTYTDHEDQEELIDYLLWYEKQKEVKSILTHVNKKAVKKSRGGYEIPRQKIIKSTNKKAKL